MKKKKFNWVFLLVLLGSMVVGMGCGMVMVKMIDMENLSFPQMLLEMVLHLGAMAVAIWMQTALHEGGHLVFGLMTGYRFSSYRLGSLMILKENGKLRLCKHKLTGTGGQCLMEPPAREDGKMPFVLYNMGGCIANLIVGVVALVLFLLLPRVRVLSFWLLIMAVMGLVNVLTNGIPFKASMMQNDGRNTLDLYRDPNSLQIFHNQLRMIEGLSRGLRLKDMPDEWFWAPPAEERKGAIPASAGVICCNRLMDAHRFDEARTAMEELLNGDTGMLDLHRRVLTCDLLYCELIGQCCWDVVEGMLTKEQKSFMQSMRTNVTVLRTQYLLALLHEKDEKKANGYLIQFNKQAKLHPYFCEVEGERELMEIAENGSVLKNGV